MPTNILRSRGKADASRRPLVPPGASLGRVLFRIGKISLRVEVFDTPTARRILAQLPLASTVETWGAAIHFETPVETGRERGARLLAEPGDICFWVEDDRILIPFGRTPISSPQEMRLPSPCNVWAKAIDDVALLKDAAAGEKVVVSAIS